MKLCNISLGCRGKRLSPKISGNFHFLLRGDIKNIFKLSKVSNILKVLKVIRVEYETSLETMNKTLFMSLLCLMKIDNIVLTKVPNIKNTVSKSLTWEIWEETRLKSKVFSLEILILLIWTNVPRTNFAWTNVQVTVVIDCVYVPRTLCFNFDQNQASNR